ncbi:MAG: hypothetical protein ACTHKU_08465, partial [Verrucomicrobiota bacterium]
PRHLGGYPKKSAQSSIASKTKTWHHKPQDKARPSTAFPDRGKWPPSHEDSQPKHSNCEGLKNH